MTKTCILLLLVLAVSGCATVERSRATLDAAKICCTSLSTLPFTSIALGTPKEIDIGEGSPAFQFPEGKSFFAAFTLPGMGMATTLDFMAGTNLNALLPASGSTVFIPQFIFLDDDFRLLQTAKDVPLVQAQKLFEPTFATTRYWSASIPVPPSAKHFIVYAQLDRVGKTIVVDYGQQAGYVFMSGSIPIYVPGGGADRRNLPIAATGPIKLRVR